MEKNDKIIYFSQDVSELVIVIGNDKFRINENEIKHFTDGTKLVGKDNMNKDRFYKFVNYLVSISNEWNDNFFVRSISPEAKWSILIKTANNGTKRYAGIEYCPNNWQDFYNNFVAFIKNEDIIQNDSNKNSNSDFNYEESINQEFNNNGITNKLINGITKFVIEIIDEYRQDRFWSDSARSFLGLLILSNLTNGNRISINNLLEQIKDINTIKNIILNNINKLNSNCDLQVFTSNVDIINSDKPLKSVIQLVEEGLNKYARNSVQNNDINELMKQVSIGNENAMKELAHKYENGDGIEKNIEKAYKIYSDLANNYNDFESKFNIACMYYFGNDYIKQDFNIAFEKFNEIKNEDIDGNILYYLGYMYDNGYGIEQNLSLAYEYYKKSAEKGFTFAEYALGQAFLQGRGIQSNDAQAVYWLKKASDKEDYMAQYVLGSLYFEGYENGMEIIKNKELGLELIRKSAIQGYDKAINKLKEIENKKVLEENDDEYNVEEYIHFTDFENLNIADDETENFDLVCGIRIESNYVGGVVEQINLYDVGKGNIFNFNGETEIKDITKDEIVIRTENNIQLSKIQSRPTEEENKIDLILKVNEFITGWSTTMPTPYRAQYKIKVMYVRKKEQLEY